MSKETLDVKREQYLKAFDIFDSECTRFWSRFNIFMGLQVVVAAGFASHLDEFVKEKAIAVSYLGLAICFSIFTCIIMHSSWRAFDAICQLINRFEEREASFVLFKTFAESGKYKLGRNALYTFLMCLLFLAFWLSLAVLFWIR